MITPTFIPAVQNLLLRRNIQADDVKVKIVVKTLLHELKSGFKFHAAILDMYEDMSADKYLKELKAV